MMPSHKGIEVWMENSEFRRFGYQEMAFDLVDDRTVTVKTEMMRDEYYTIHCLSPVSVFCEVYITTSSSLRKRSARFHLNKQLAISHVSGSSLDHTEGQYRYTGLRTPKKQFQQGKLGSVYVEIRRTSEVTNGELRVEYEDNGGVTDDGGVTEFYLIDDFSQPPWVIFRFDIGVKDSGLGLAPASAKEHVKKQAPKTCRKRIQDTKGNEISCKKRYTRFRKCKRRHTLEEPQAAGICEAPIHGDLDQLRREYQKEQTEEHRLRQKLKDQLQMKKTQNMELRKLLGERA